MTDHAASGLEPKLTPEERVALAPLSDDENPAIEDAKKAFTIAVWSTLLFVGVIVVFILL
jgi:hypothetical protein